MTIEITLKDRTKATITGQTVSFPGYPDVEFICHRDIQNPKLWMVTEVVTGFRCIVHAQTTRKAAKWAAERNLTSPGGHAHVRAEIAKVVSA
jgi:hypothetical protein